ncbi:MAG TPA: hypothetical protein VE153_39500 [Myxococcus sp.]|nr:hypothetical protein [Myxococcus sp.]
MNVRWLAVWLVVLVGFGCAHSPRASSEPQVPQFEHVFQKPLPEAMAVTRELLAAQGYAFEDTQDPSQLLTRWKSPGTLLQNNVSYSRYLVTGIAVSPRQSVVRIFRMALERVGNNVHVRSGWYNWLHEMNELHDEKRLQPVVLDPGGSLPAEMRAAMRGTRDLELEKALTLRLESGPSVEVVDGNIKQDLPPPPVRDADFYLARWKDTAPRSEGLCGEDVRGLPALVAPGLTLLIGEQLGTRETPEVVGHVVCQTAELGLPVTLGLAIPREEQERLERYLASPGAPADQDTLLEGRFWHRPYQDGRSSRAIFDLIDRVRAMRAAGLRVTLVAYDTNTAHSSARDTEQAKVWLARRKAWPKEVHIVLAGNTHTRLVRGTPWDKDFTPMGLHLKDDRLVVLELSYAQGTRWGCDLNRAGKLACGFIGATPSDAVAAMPGQSPYIRRLDSLSKDGYHGLLYVGELTPSLPATSKHKEAPPPSSMPKPPPMVKHPPMF